MYHITIIFNLCLNIYQMFIFRFFVPTFQFELFPVADCTFRLWKLLDGWRSWINKHMVRQNVISARSVKSVIWLLLFTSGTGKLSWIFFTISSYYNPCAKCVCRPTTYLNNQGWRWFIFMLTPSFTVLDSVAGPGSDWSDPG